jgi:hypothetical protein
MEDTQNDDPVLLLDVERDVLSHWKGSQAGGDCVALSPNVGRQAELLERKVQFFTIALRLCLAPTLFGVANDLQPVRDCDGCQIMTGPRCALSSNAL